MMLAERRIQFVLNQAIDGMMTKIFYLIHDGDPSEIDPYLFGGTN